MRWDRGTWDYEIRDGWNAGDAVDVTITPNHVLFAVTQEQAVDSYNQTFTCSIEVPYENVAGLYAVLGEALAKRAAITAGTRSAET